MGTDRLSRRGFLRRAGATSLLLPALAADAAGLPSAPASESTGAIGLLATRLLDSWGEGLLRFQVRTLRDPAFYGGLLCPACARIHGRCGDAVYPFLRLAGSSGEERFLDAARLVFDWMENVSRQDGSWVNDPFNDWRGITVFGAIALGEALRYHGELLEADLRDRLRDRLARAARFLDGFLAPTTGNVNYRMSAPLAFALAASVLGESRYRERAREFAGLAHASILPSGLLFGEGHPNDRVSPRGCRAVDLGYDVEESLPNLAAYATLAGDRPLLQLVASAWRAHLEFLLPDGGWDNSWGTRNYKWTYWGSRTTDGAPAGLLLAGPEDPVFREAALRNLQLLERCTHDGLLYGGPHLHRSGARPCLHHTFAHAKMLAAILDHGAPGHAAGVILPREAARGVRRFRDIDSWLVAHGPWRATVTASDWQYVPEGNASGGALSLLWHERAGVLVAASMTRYQMVEPHNQVLHARPTPALTPSIEATIAGVTYRSLNDLGAKVEGHQDADGCEIVATGTLRDGEQRTPGTPLAYLLAYRFAGGAVRIHVRADGPADAVRFVMPLVSSDDEPVTVRGSELTVTKPNAPVRVSTPRPLRDPGSQRVFNHVPGFQALPLVIDLVPGQEMMLEIRVG